MVANATRFGGGTLHVKGMDVVTSKENVTEAFKRKIGKRNMMHVGDLRPIARNPCSYGCCGCRGSEEPHTRDCEKGSSKKYFKCGDDHFAKECKSEEIFCSAFNEKGHKRRGEV